MKYPVEMLNTDRSFGHILVSRLQYEPRKEMLSFSTVFHLKRNDMQYAMLNKAFGW